MVIDPGVDPDFRDMVRTFFSRKVGSNGSHAPRGGFDAELWRQLEELGFTLLTASEDRGGSGASWAEAATLHYAIGFHAVDIPLAEHDLLAGWLTEVTGLAPVDAPTSVGIAHGRVFPDGEVVVPFGECVERVLLVHRDEGGVWWLSDLGRDEIDATTTSGLSVTSRARVRAQIQATRVVLSDDVVRELIARGALARSLQMCGALVRCVDHAVEHARVRMQFGQPLVKFQAVQALLADAAGEAAVAKAATGAAVAAWLWAEQFDENVERAVAVAKSCASHAVEIVTRNAHQVLGAMGTTMEHNLHHVSIPLLVWQHEFGAARDWDRYLARAAVADGAGSLWEQLTQP